MEGTPEQEARAEEMMNDEERRSSIFREQYLMNHQADPELLKTCNLEVHSGGWNHDGTRDEIVSGTIEDGHKLRMEVHMPYNGAWEVSRAYLDDQPVDPAGMLDKYYPVAWVQSGNIEAR